MGVVGVLLVACIAGTGLVAASDYAGHYTNDFAVEVDGGPQVAELVAEATGFTFIRHLRRLGDVYHFRNNAVSHRSKRSADQHIEALRNDPNVRYVEQQKILGRYRRAAVREKRYIVHDKQLEDLMFQNRADVNPKSMKVGRELKVTVEEMGINFNDPQFPRMWYLINKGQTDGPPNYDVNVLPVWKKNITGNGVVVCILDDGIDYTHKDLAANYDPEASADFNDQRDKNNDPMPQGDKKANSHGTKCAAEVAAVANNSVCGVGVAYNANIGGVRLLDGLITDMMEGDALLFNNNYIDIYSASWGPSDDGATMEGPGRYATDAMKKAAENGRGGKGSLFIWATGNGGANDDDCSCDGYVSSIYSISIGCISDHGLSTYYSEVCPSTLAVIFVGGSHMPPGSEGYEDPPIKVITVDVGGNGEKCTDRFQGTSAAAPLAAGCFALVLEANPSVTWRDAQNIVVETARVPNPDEPGWIINGGGYHLNHRFGFGSLDCGKMVEAAQNWNTVPDQKICEVAAGNAQVSVPALGSVNQTLSTDGCEGTDNQIDRLENVQVHIELSHPVRGEVSIWLFSPHGTPSHILSTRKHDTCDDGIDWTFMTVHNWGENPEGSWTLMVEDTGESGKGELVKWSITLRGTQGKNVNAKADKPASSEEDSKVSSEKNQAVADNDHREHLSEAASVGEAAAHIADTDELNDIMEVESKDSNTVDIRDQSLTGESNDKKVVTADNFYNQVAAILLSSNGNILKKKQLVERFLEENEKGNINQDPPPEKHHNNRRVEYSKRHRAEKIVHAKELPIARTKDVLQERMGSELNRRKQGKGEVSDEALLRTIDMLEQRVEDAKRKEREKELAMEKRREEIERREYVELLSLLNKVLEASD